MAFVVTENCIMCKHTDCVAACPVDCFFEGENFLAINPDECIDCGMCVSECPVNAIKAKDALAPNEIGFAALNRELSQLWPNINTMKAPLTEAGDYANRPDKLKLLSKAPAGESLAA